MSEWSDIMEKIYHIKVPRNGTYSIQGWLKDQSSEDTGCPLVDNPFIFEENNDNTVQ